MAYGMAVLQSLKNSGEAFVLTVLVALWPAILRFAAALAALILRLQPAGCDFGEFKKT